MGGRARYVMPVKTIGPDYNTVGSTWSKVATFFEGVTYEDNVNGGLTSANLTGSPQIFKKGKLPPQCTTAEPALAICARCSQQLVEVSEFAICDCCACLAIKVTGCKECWLSLPERSHCV